MSPARWPRSSKLEESLIVVDPATGRLALRSFAALPDFVPGGSLVVVNDAATLPASLRGRTSDGKPVEARLIASDGGPWRAVLFGAGDWTTRTEHRPAPPAVKAGERLLFDGPLQAHVERLDPASDRLVTLRFDATGDALYAALYRSGRPVQYAHLDAPLPLWHVQTAFAARPWASEMPSAGRPLSWELILSMRARGVRFASITHAAGLSSTGDDRLDAALPLRESYDVPPATALAVQETRARHRPVVAIGTTVVRALEASALAGAGSVQAGKSETDLRIDAHHPLRAVDAILTGMHEPGTSHAALLEAFAPAGLLDRAFTAADDAGFLGHEFGDSMLVAAGSLPLSASGEGAGR
jgi:S-adenosylmethionine:tRNA ribosyltransferase-isomerase